MPTSAVYQRSERFYVNATWLLRLRWVAVVGQLTTVGCVSTLFGVELQMPALLTLMGIAAISNLGLFLWLRRFSRRQSDRDIPRGYVLLECLTTVDLVLLTGMLYFAGGPQNPFLIFYFVNLSLSAILLHPRWCWPLTAIAMVGFGCLFVDHVPVPELHETFFDVGLTLQQLGLLVAVPAGSLVIVYFVTRVTGELRNLEHGLRLADQRQAHSQRLEALATLAAGAGHELATPLSTIAVISKELTRHLEGVDVPQSVQEDLTLIRSELDHCRGILDRMSAHAGQAVGEQMETIVLADLLNEVVDGLRSKERVNVILADVDREKQLTVPLDALGQAIRGIVQNGLDASINDTMVDIEGKVVDDYIEIRVQDRGTGMNSATLARAGEPFFTTKETGKGMGLGLFLSQSVIERMGGKLTLSSRYGHGTTALIEIPVAR